MRSVLLDLPTFGFIVGTRAALACGIGLLLADRLSEDRRRAVGLTLVIVGAATTIPAVAALRGHLSREDPVGVGRDARLMRSTRFARKGDDDL